MPDLSSVLLSIQGFTNDLFPTINRKMVKWRKIEIYGICHLPCGMTKAPTKTLSAWETKKDPNTNITMILNMASKD